MTERFDLTPAALYARVSSDRQDVDLSIAAQLRALRDYAEKNDYLVAREYVDEAESGRIADRPEFQKMLNEANKPEAPFKEILVWKFSRFTRKREHAVAFKSMIIPISQSTPKAAVLVGGRFGCDRVRSGGSTGGRATSTLIAGPIPHRWAYVDGR